MVSYTVTHHKVTCTVVARAAAAGAGSAAQRWVTPRQLAALPLSSPGRRIAKLVVSSGSP